MPGWRDTIQGGAASATAPQGGWRGTVQDAGSKAPATPWAKYSSTGTGIRENKASSYPTTPTNPKVIQEQHPDIGTGDRLLAENFAAGEPDKVRYLKEQHPNLEIKQDPQDARQILIRRPGESDYRVLNPTLLGHEGHGSTLDKIGQGLKETALDVGGNLYGLGAGLASGAATTAGGLAGGVAGAVGGPAGALAGAGAGAMAAGGASGAALETTRQELGQLLGVNQKTDPEQIKMMGLLGAAAPIAFGAGPELRGALPEAAGWLRQNVAPKVGSLVSGVSESAINAAKKYLPDFPGIAKNGVESLVTGARDDAEDLLRQHLTASGENIKSVVGSPGVQVDLSTAEQELKNHLDHLQNLKAEKATPGIQSKISDIESILKEHFGGVPEARPVAAGEDIHPLYPELAPPPPSATGASSPLPPTFTPKGPTVVSGTRAWDLKKDLDALAKLHATPQFGAAQSTSVAQSQSTDALKNASLDLYSQLDNATGGAFSAANERHGTLKTMEKQLQPFFNDTTGQRGYTKLSNVFNEANEPTLNALKEIDSTIGSNLGETADILQGYKQFGGKPELLAKSGGGTTSTSRTNLLGDAGAAAADLLVPHSSRAARIARAVASPAGGPKALKAYMKAGAFGSDYLNQLGGYSPATASAWTMLQGQGGNAP